MRRIAKMNVMPPGGYQYVQPETGMKFGGNETLKAQSLLILAHRKGNRLARATFEEVAEDIVESVCARVPGVCVEVASGKGISPSSVTQTAGLRPTRRCGSCGGRKTTT